MVRKASILIQPTIVDKEQWTKPFFVLFVSTSYINSKGFIAGVTNQLFEDRTAWWDVLCNIDTGKITVSKDIIPLAPSAYPNIHYDDTRSLQLFSGAASTPPSNKYDNGDNEFMADVSFSSPMMIR